MKASTIWAPRILSLLRIVLGLVLLQYGLAKLFGWPVVRMFANVQWYSLWGIAGMFELVGGTLLILGLFTRPVAFILSGEMAAAYFIEHFPHSYLPILSAGDLAVSLCFAFLYISFAGGGPWSLDAMRQTTDSAPAG
ncbi:MAG TPA: DoxX family protein [Bradyrhizobium sp.]|jgi:putative oxidoreductase|nr:DoxX family protein [Bradyrhizobium sp.]